MRNLLGIIIVTALLLFINLHLKADQFPTDWGTDTDIETYQAATVVQSGSYSCKIDINSENQANCDLINHSALPVNSGDSYTVNFWYQSSPHVKARIVLYWNGDSADYGSYGDLNITSWTQFSASGTVPAGCDSVKIGLRYYDSDGFTAPETQYLDNISFESPAGNHKPVSNGNFESWTCSPSVGIVYISEVSDASYYKNEFLELYNNSADIIDLTHSKIIMQSDGTVFDIDEYDGDKKIQPHSLFVMTRGAIKSGFENEWGSLPEGVTYNKGSTIMYLGTATARRWILKDGGTSDTDDGMLIDDTGQTVAGADKRHYQDPVGTWNEADISTASPGALEGNQDSSLPVELQGFKALPFDNKVILSWTTYSEIENQGFVLYRKCANEPYQLLSSYRNNPNLTGQGTSTEQHDYQFIDTSVRSGNYYAYLLSDIDYQGRETRHYDLEITVRIPAVKQPAHTLGLIYPNPFNTDFNIPITLSDALPVQIEIFNIRGTLVKIITLPLIMPGSHRIACTSEGLSTGIYLLRIKVGADHYYKKLVFLK